MNHDGQPVYISEIADVYSTMYTWIENPKKPMKLLYLLDDRYQKGMEEGMEKGRAEGMEGNQKIDIKNSPTFAKRFNLQKL